MIFVSNCSSALEADEVTTSRAGGVAACCWGVAVDGVLLIGVDVLLLGVSQFALPFIEGGVA